ncbi:hypothetical protein EK904_003176, partial [Melospiza melodia maxima]
MVLMIWRIHFFLPKRLLCEYYKDILNYFKPFPYKTINKELFKAASYDLNETSIIYLMYMKKAMPTSETQDTHGLQPLSLSEASGCREDWGVGGSVPWLQSLIALLKLTYFEDEPPGTDFLAVLTWQSQQHKALNIQLHPIKLTVMLTVSEMHLHLSPTQSAFSAYQQSNGYQYILLCARQLSLRSVTCRTPIYQLLREGQDARFQSSHLALESVERGTHLFDASLKYSEVSFVCGEYQLKSWIIKRQICQIITQGKLSLKRNINNATERKEIKNQIPHLRAWDRRKLPNHLGKLKHCDDYKAGLEFSRARERCQERRDAHPYGNVQPPMQHSTLQRPDINHSPFLKETTQ